MKIELICSNCKKKFTRESWKIKKTKSGKYFCSHSCQVEYFKSNFIAVAIKNVREKLSGSKHPRYNKTSKKCLYCGKDYKVCRARLETSKFCSKTCKDNFFRENSFYFSFKKIGVNNPMWNGGKSFLRYSIRKLAKYKQWRQQIFERDNYTCQKCGQRGGNLEVHHSEVSYNSLLTNFLKKYSQFSPVEDRETLVRLAITYEPFWDINNGITLCKKCHRLLHLKIKEKIKT